MLKRFFPDIYVDSALTVPYEELWRRGVRGIVLDIDNTLVPYDIETPTMEAADLLARLAGMGFNVCLLSNNSRARVDKFNQELCLPAVPRAGKPGLSGVRRAMELIGASPGNTAQIGDQVFTDVWCGNRLGLYTVLVKPMSDRDEFTVRLKRGVERLVVNHYLKWVNKHDTKRNRR